MSFDAYSPCPGGRGKKIKFCCPDLLNELNDISKMMAAEQYAAALREVERLEAKKSGCACLTISRIELLRELDRVEEALAVAEQLIETEPDNPLAWTYLAQCRAIVHDDGAAALEAWLSAVENSDANRAFSETLETMLVIAHRLLRTGDLVPAVALAYFHDVAAEERSPDSLWLRLQGTPGIPLLLKSIPFFPECPEEVTWKPEYDAAIGQIDELLWRSALGGLASLTDKADEFPWIWQVIGMLRLWLLDRDGAIDALRHLAAAPIDLEDAVEARLFSILLEEDPLGDQIEMQTLTYTVEDFDRVHETLLSWDHAAPMPTPGDQWDSERFGPPPRTAAAVFDRPKADDDAEPDPASIPRFVADALLFGKETDRPARLVLVEVAAPEQEQVEASLRERLGDALGERSETQAVRDTSSTYLALRPRWRLPRWSDPAKAAALLDRYYTEFFLESWPTRPLPVLDGKSPEEAAADSALRVDVLAIIHLLEQWSSEFDSRFDFNELRRRLGLPTLDTLEPIDRYGVMRISPMRLHRLPVDRMQDDALAAAFARASMSEDKAGIRTTGEEIMRRESLAAHPLRERVCISLAVHADTPEDGFAWVERGREVCARNETSCAQLDLLEISMRARNREPQKMVDLIKHVTRDHVNEPGITEKLAHLLSALGILRPDGTVPRRPEQAAEAPVAESETASSSGLWTPDGGGAQPSEGSAATGSKLWTPDMG